MPTKQVTKIVYECTCSCKSHPDCAHSVKPWYSDTIPTRCASCKCRTWNRDSLVSASHPLTFNGETHTVSEWARRLGFSKTAIQWRLKQGWPLDQVLSKDDWRFQQ